MSNRSGSPYSTPRDANRVPFLTAASTADGITPVVLEADPTTHLLQVSSSGGGGGGTQYTDGSSTITHPIGTIPVYDKAGTITAVSVANPLPVSASITPPSDTTQTGSITGSGQSVTFAVNAQSTVGVQVSGTFSGTILIKGSVDGSTYTPTTATSLSTGGLVSTITSSFTGQVNVAGFVSFQLTSVSWSSGTANISLRASTGISNIMLDNPLPSGTNTIGAVTQATGTNLHTVVDSGTVTANIGTSGSLALDATLTGGTQQTKVTDGTNIANVVAGDTGYNGLATAGASKSYTFTTSTAGAQTIGPYNCEGYSWIEVVYTSVGVGLALTGQFSTTSGGTYVTAANTWQASSSTASAPTALGAVVNVIYSGPIRGNYFQLNVTTLTSGTFTGTVTLRDKPMTSTVFSATQNGTWLVGSNSATGSAVPANAFYMAGINNSGNLAGANMANNSDGATGNGILASGPWVYDGTNWDRVRSATSASNTTGTGLLGAGLLGFDGTNYQKLLVDGSTNLKVTNTTALPAGTNTIGSVSVTNQNTQYTESTTVATNTGIGNLGMAKYLASGLGTLTNNKVYPLTLDSNGYLTVGGNYIASISSNISNLNGTTNRANTTANTYGAMQAGLDTATGNAQFINVDATGNQNVNVVSDLNPNPSHNTLNYGQVVLGTNSTVFVGSSVPVYTHVIVKPLSTNVASVYIGDSSVVTSTGIELAPFNTSTTPNGATDQIKIPINDVSLLFGISTNGTDGISWLAV